MQPALLPEHLAVATWMTGKAVLFLGFVTRTVDSICQSLTALDCLGIDVELLDEGYKIGVERHGAKLTGLCLRSQDISA